MMKLGDFLFNVETTWLCPCVDVPTACADNIPARTNHSSACVDISYTCADAFPLM